MCRASFNNINTHTKVFHKTWVRADMSDRSSWCAGTLSFMKKGLLTSAFLLVCVQMPDWQTALGPGCGHGQCVEIRMASVCMHLPWEHTQTHRTIDTCQSGTFSQENLCPQSCMSLLEECKATYLANVQYKRITFGFTWHQLNVSKLKPILTQLILSFFRSHVIAPQLYDFHLQKTKRETLTNVGNRTTLDLIDFHCMNTKSPRQNMKSLVWKCCKSIFIIWVKMCLLFKESGKMKTTILCFKVSHSIFRFY